MGSERFKSTSTYSGRSLYMAGQRKLYAQIINNKCNKNININERCKISWQAIQLKASQIWLKELSLCYAYNLQRLLHIPWPIVSAWPEASFRSFEKSGCDRIKYSADSHPEIFVQNTSLSPIKEKMELKLSAAFHRSQKFDNAFHTNLIFYTILTTSASECSFSSPSLIQSVITNRRN